MSTIRLKIGHGNARFEERTLSPGKYLLGRESCDILLSDENVSARHAELNVQPQRIIITDLGSRNGTFDPSGKRLSAPYALVPNQAIRLGASSLTWLQAAVVSPLRVNSAALARTEKRRRTAGLWLFWIGSLIGL